MRLAVISAARPARPWCHALGAWLVSTSLAACATYSGTTRVVEGRTLEGRALPPAAYSAYTAAAYLESRGELEQAALSYETAIDHDPESAELWTRLGSVRCRSTGDAQEAFEEAMSVDETYAPAYREASQCLVLQGQYAQALPVAKQAIQLDPGDAKTSLLVVEILHKLKRHGEARQWLMALSLLQPAGASVAIDSPALSDEQRKRQELTLALLGNELPRSRALAQELSMASDSLAIYALQVGALSAALAQAELVHRADPQNSNARIALLVAGLLLADDAAIATALASPGERSKFPSTASAQLLAQTLDAVVNSEASALFLAAHSERGAVLDQPAAPTPAPPVPEQVKEEIRRRQQPATAP